MVYVLLAIIGVFALLLLFKLVWNTKRPLANPKIILIATGVLVAILLFATMRGMVHPLAAVGTAILPFLRRALGLLTALPFLAQFARMGNPFGGAFNAGAFQQFGTKDQESGDSNASTGELAMTLDHASGNIDGKVLVGTYSGRQVNSLSDAELANLYHSLKEEESRRLLEAYIERHRPNLGEREASNDPDTSIDGEMSPKRAADILGIDVGATEKEIVSAHRRIIQHLHPDKGGSSYLAAQINEARRVLLDQL